MKPIHLIVMALLSAVFTLAQAIGPTRIKDLGRLDGWRDNQLIGYGVVTGLAGSGDSMRNRATRQSVSNMLSQFNLTVSSDQINSRNVAIVMLTATLPAFARAGDKLDVTVASAGDARSLLGGVLMMAPLKGPDNRVHALAQGAISVGGYKYDLNGNVVQKNHPTVGAIPAGANVELGETTEVLGGMGKVVFVLNQPDYTTSARIARAINATFGNDAAKARDASSVDIKVDGHQRDNLVAFLTRLENSAVEPDTRARVIVNERTGIVISGGDVRMSKVTIAHGDLKVSIATENQVSQPQMVSFTGPGVRTEVVSNTRIDVTESTGVALESGNTVADLVKALNRIKTSTRDIISILQGIKAAGALHAELIIQ
ncbi:MAG: flagellar basal body P-ring protein FlgI [Pseudomonadota bacterium]